MLGVPFFALGDEKGITVVALRTEKLPAALNSIACSGRLRPLPELFSLPYEHDLLFL